MDIPDWPGLGAGQGPYGEDDKNTSNLFTFLTKNWNRDEEKAKILNSSLYKVTKVRGVV